MKKPAAICVLLALLMGTALADGQACVSRESAPYWHLDGECRFGETGWYAEAHGIAGEARTVTVAEAEAGGQKPCPGCAAAR